MFSLDRLQPQTREIIRAAALLLAAPGFIAVLLLLAWRLADVIRDEFTDDYRQVGKGADDQHGPFISAPAWRGGNAPPPRLDAILESWGVSTRRGCRPA
jgi:hypothetical protein